MAKTGVLCSATLAALLFLGACEKPLHRATTPPPGTQTAPVTLIMTDTPPTGVSVLSFQITVTGATLQPGNVPLISSAVQLQAATLQTSAVPLSTANVPVGTYSSISFNLASPVFTVLNRSGGTLAGCANNSICKLSGANPSSISFTGLPFPVTVTANTPVGLLADLSLKNIIQSNLSLKFDATSLSLSVLPSVSLTGTLQTIEGFLGQVTAHGTNQFTMKNFPSGLALTISVNASTTFQNFDTIGCTASPQNFSCVQVGQIVAVDLNFPGNGTLVATTVDAEDAASQQDLEGVLVATGPLLGQFQMVLLDEEPSVSSVSVGDEVLVNIVQPATFGIDADGLSVPSTFTFASTTDLFVGQEIQVQVTSVFPNPSGGQAVDTSRVRLRMSQFTASVNTKVNATTFTVTGLNPSGLPSLLTTGPVTVSTSAQTEFNPSNLTVSALNIGDTVSLRGLLFSPTSGPTLVTRNVRKR